MRHHLQAPLTAAGHKSEQPFRYVYRESIKAEQTEVNLILELDFKELPKWEFWSILNYSSSIAQEICHDVFLIEFPETQLSSLDMVTANKNVWS